MSSFCDISKAHTDVLEKDFPTTWGVEAVANNGKHGVTVSASRTDDGVCASIKPKHRCDWGEFTTTVGSCGLARVEVSVTDKLPKGTKLDVTAEWPKNPSGKLAVEYNADKFNVKAHVNHEVEAKKTTGAACALFTHKEWSAGGSAHFEVGTGLTCASFGGRYKNDRAVSALRLHHKDKKLSADFGILYHLQNAGEDVAAQVKHDVEKKETSVQVAFSRTLSDASWKAKIGSDSVAAVSYTHNWNKNTKITSAVQFNVTDPAQSKVGVQVKYTD
jgi:hypothetical protein